MAKYDQGGGCPCGLYKECECDRITPTPKYLGSHVLLDIKFKDNKIEQNDKFLTVPYYGVSILWAAAEKAGAQVLFQRSKSFGEGQGYTTILGLAESHISMHTWPEKDAAAIDVFMCGNCDPMIAAKYILEHPIAKPSHHMLQEIPRGLFRGMH